MESVLTKPAPAKTEKEAAEKKQEFKIIKIRRYKLFELAEIYEVDRKTFRGWVNKFRQELGEREGHFYTIPQVQLIFSKLKLPSYVRLNLENGDDFDNKK